MSRLLILANGAPGRADRLAAVRQAFAGLPADIVATADAATAVAQLQRWAPAPDDLLVVDGGDGTLQALLTALWAWQPDVQVWPTLCALPGGTTNMSANGLAGRWLRHGATVRWVAGCWASGRWQGRRQAHVVLRAVADGVDHLGLFWGTGSVVRGIEYHQQRLAEGARRGAWAPGLAVLRTLWGLLGQQPPFNRPTLVAEEGAAAQRLVVLLATPLERLLLGLRPFVPGAAAGKALHLTRVAAGTPRLPWRLAQLLAGRLPAGVTGVASRTTVGVEVQLDGPWTIDGELHPPPVAALDLMASAPVRWLVP